ncbi:MAG: hypothetical protein IJQ43_05025 [Oscillospiraceae bacterium]|nr:hypothetical protein [Oscillospiraceae bacterium]
MAKYLKESGSSGNKENTRKSAAKIGAPQPPSTLPVPKLRDVPIARDGTMRPTEVDPLLFGNGDGADDRRAAEKAPSVPRSSPSVPAAASAGTKADAKTGADLAFRMPDRDAEAAARYESALAEIERLSGEAPRYDSRYDAEIRELYGQIASRAPFRYDSATDPLYQQYRQEYTAQGRAAMRDTMGQAAALTGGYGSSYAQSAAQQQYDAYLRRLADVLPETYGMALDAWKAEGEDLQRRYAAANALEKSDYDRYLDELGQYNRSLERARSDADTAYERMIAGDERAYRLASDDYKRRLEADKLAYQRAKDSAKSSSSGGRRKTKKTQTAAAPAELKASKTKKRVSRTL